MDYLAFVEIPNVLRPDSSSPTEAFLRLLLNFQSLPKPKRSRTFMEISGYPHYENVCSNVLAFYLRPGEEHGLRDLLTRALLRMGGLDDAQVSNVEVKREQTTVLGNRLDLVIAGDAFVIGIENKIYQGVYNDLSDYAAVIDGLSKGTKRSLKVVLGLHRTPEPLKGDFRSFTYPELWKCVKELLGDYLASANAKWLTYFIDFMETINTLAGGNPQQTNLDQFFIQHDGEVTALIEARNAFLERLSQRVTTLLELFRKSPEAQLLNQPAWIYSDRCLVCDFHIDGHAIAFDLYLKSNGWELQLFGRNKKARAYLLGLVAKSPLRERAASAPIEYERHVVERWPILTDLGVINEALCSWVRDLLAAGKA